MKWVETQGKRPRTADRLLHVRFRNGEVSKQPYRADQMRWSQSGDPWDVVAVARAE
jgi:hypothetical protein